MEAAGLEAKWQHALGLEEKAKMSSASVCTETNNKEKEEEKQRGHEWEDTNWEEEERKGVSLVYKKSEGEHWER